MTLLMEEAFKVNRECQESKIAVVDAMTTRERESFFRTQPVITKYLAKASKLRQVNWQLKSYHSGECKACTKRKVPKYKGKVNFSTLKGLAYYKKAMQLLAKFVPICFEKYPIHVKISTISNEFQGLCSFVPFKW